MHRSPALEDRSTPVVDRLAADDHRFDAPAEGVCRIRASEVLVTRTVVASGETLEGAGRDDCESGQPLTAAPLHRCVGPGELLVGLAVEDDQGHIRPRVEDRFEGDRAVRYEDLEAGRFEFLADGHRLPGGQ